MTTINQTDSETPIFSSPQSDNRLPGVGVPPIRSLTVRDPPHYNSTVNLKPSHKQSDTSDPESDSVPDVYSTINRTIEVLEKFLRETGPPRHTGKKDEPAPESTIPSDLAIASTKRRPSQAIASRAARYLQQSPTQNQSLAPTIELKPQKRISFSLPVEEHDLDSLRDMALQPTQRVCQPAHKQQLGNNKARLANPQLSLDANIVMEQPPTAKGEVAQNDRQLEILEPIAEPAAVEPLTHTKDRAKKRRPISRGSILTYMQRHGEQLIPPRLTSSKVVTSPRREVQSANSQPTLQLNGGDLPGTPDEQKDQHGVDEDKQFLSPHIGHERHFTQIFGVKSRQVSIDLRHVEQPSTVKLNLKRSRHVDVMNTPVDYDLHQSCSHAPIARDWPSSRKRFTAFIACVTTACVGLVIGIYAGEVPAIQYVIADFDHYTILGNVFLYIGLAISTFLMWPLPLLHGRKPYTVIGLALSLCLQIPQGIVTGNYRTPDHTSYRVMLLLSRGMSGLTLGLTNINLKATLLDCFGASLQSKHPHGELVDEYDVRRHGGGMGLWLAFWSWCTIGSIGLGFAIGAFIIDASEVEWGFWTSLLLLMFAILLNVFGPEVRRSAFRRTIAEMIDEGYRFDRVARGEIKMHLDATGPFWWGDEVLAGIRLCWMMVKQPGFMVLALYTAWVYAEFSMVLMLLGGLASIHYRYRPAWVGLCVVSLPLGAMIAVPFEKASVFSRARSQPPRTDSMTFQSSFVWSSHLVRRMIFTLLLPLSAIAYMLSSRHPPFPIAIPCVFAGLVGAFSNLAIAECYGWIMETFDTSDLQAGMTGRPVTEASAKRYAKQRTNFSCHPRISAGVAIVQSLAFVMCAVVTELCGRLQRRVGSMRASAVVAAVLFGLTVLMTMVLWRLKSVQMIPTRSTLEREGSQMTVWEPIVLGRPSGLTRKVSLLEAGKQTRWSEIRRRNRLNTGLTGS